MDEKQCDSSNCEQAVDLNQWNTASKQTNKQTNKQINKQLNKLDINRQWKV